MALTDPTINGNRFGYASIAATLAGRPYRGIKSINYKDNLEPGEVRGTSPQLIGATRGQYKAEADVEFYEDEWCDFRDALGDGFMEVPWQLLVNYQEEGADVQTDELYVRISGVDASRSEGTEPLTRKLKLFVLLPIKHNGLAPFKDAVM